MESSTAARRVCSALLSALSLRRALYAVVGLSVGHRSTKHNVEEPIWDIPAELSSATSSGTIPPFAFIRDKMCINPSIVLSSTRRLNGMALNLKSCNPSQRSIRIGGCTHVFVVFDAVVE